MTAKLQPVIECADPEPLARLFPAHDQRPYLNLLGARRIVMCVQQDIGIDKAGGYCLWTLSRLQSM